MNKKKIIITVVVLLLVLLALILFLVTKNPKTVYTVSFNSDGGEAVSSIKIEDGKNAEKPENPTKDGYEFLGWYIGDEKYDFSKLISKDVVLTAKWRKIEDVSSTVYTITLNVDGKTTVLKTDEKGVLKQPTAPTKQGYKFLGWYLDNEKVDFTKPFTTDSEIVAKWEKVETTKNTNTKTNTKTNTNNKANTNTNKDNTEKTVTVTKYTVTFNSNGGSSVSNQTVESGKTVSKPVDPIKAGYSFEGWYLNNTVYNFSSKVTGNITLTAKWKEIKDLKIETQEIPGSTVGQIRIFVTLNGNRINGTVTKTSKSSGKSVTVNVPKEGLLINKNTSVVSNPQES